MPVGVLKIFWVTVMTESVNVDKDMPEEIIRYSELSKFTNSADRAKHF